jgi:hypothetical protein
MSYRVIPGAPAREGGDGLAALILAAAPSSDHYIQNLTVWLLFRDAYGPRGTSAPIPT